MRWTLLSVWLFACGSDHVPNGPLPGNAVACQHDSECANLPCGPCSHDTIITQDLLGQECVVNPCKTPAAYCTPKHVCAVK
jgi:hypothetical protein